MPGEAKENEGLTEERQQQGACVGSEYGEQGAHGYDLSLFRENLRRTPTERIERLQSAHNFFVEVEKACADRISKIHRVNAQ